MNGESTSNARNRNENQFFAKAKQAITHNTAKTLGLVALATAGVVLYIYAQREGYEDGFGEGFDLGADFGWDGGWNAGFDAGLAGGDSDGGFF